uniref:Uncharacterized protein n=2 Tax=Craspedostauros australis TaxID=1486917 RepID=A0A7R9WR44_9STRA|mmetsp:Transcript_14403/g.39663  ORF Transcript_14403/g.39663 Transcript_14403/m.39663 type:complete len:183 (+) Transcript_14403:240-788(+)
MMNALVALDDMQASNNMNMNLAAVTPAVFLIYACQRMLRFVRYALLKLGKSKEETYGSFQHGLLEMERLLVMRDNSSSYQTPMLRHDSVAGAGPAQQTRGGLRHDGIVLRSDDLGMMMLHIHELRTILWRDRRRFSSNDIRSVAEDLAELAGERGAVCVSQQIQIIARMSRTYAFLRVRNHG